MHVVAVTGVVAVPAAIVWLGRATWSRVVELHRSQLFTSRSMAAVASASFRSPSGPPGGDGVGDAVAQVVVEHPDGHALERLGDGRDLGQHVDAVAVGLDHLLRGPGPGPPHGGGGPAADPCTSRNPAC